MKELRYAIVGFGGVAKHHALASYQAALQFGDEVCPRLVGLMNRTPKESPLPGVPHFTDLEEMVAACKPDFLDLCLPQHLREEAIRFAAERGIPIYCEKPLAANLEQAELFADLAREIPTAMAFEFRCVPAVHLMKKHLELIGPLFDFKAQFLHDSYLLPRAKTWRMTAVNGGGSLLDLGVHFVDLLYFILGEPEYRSGSKGIYFTERNEVDEYGTVHMTAGGVPGTLTTSRIHATDDRSRTITLFGEKGQLSIDLDRPYELHHYDLAERKTTVYRASKELLAELMYPGNRDSLGDYQDAHTSSLLHFARYLYTGQEDPTIATFEDGLMAQEFLANILEN